MKTILAVGDSWASAVEADTGRNAGWPEILAIPETLRQGVNGSTAAQWAADTGGRLTRARDTEADAVVVSLLGNDARALVSRGNLSVGRLQRDSLALGFVVSQLKRPTTIVMLYASPYPDVRSVMGVWLLNAVIVEACKGLPVQFANTSQWLGVSAFDGKDIHPIRAGHEIIAERIAKMLP